MWHLEALCHSGASVYLGPWWLGSYSSEILALERSADPDPHLFPLPPAQGGTQAFQILADRQGANPIYKQRILPDLCVHLHQG